MSEDVLATLAARRGTHGIWREQAATASTIRKVLHLNPGWRHLPPYVSEAIDMIVTKISRAVEGDWEHEDHWDDIAGYAKLVSLEIEKDNEPRN